MGLLLVLIIFVCGTMPNIYIRKHPEKFIDEKIVKKALMDIQNKTETPTSAARKYNINRTTLLYRLKNIAETGATNSHLQDKFSTKYSVSQVLTTVQEAELAEYFKKCSNLHHGLTFDLAKRFVYEYVTKNQIKYPSSWNEEQRAGKVWLMGFMRRNPQISLRKPENISIARLRAFTRPVVEEFFSKLKCVLLKYSFKANRIYNLDETGITTVMDSIKVIAEKGKRTVSQTASAERGTLVTMVAIINAAGNHVAPVYICPRKRANPLFMNGAVPGALGLFSESGWINAELHIIVLKHIKNNVKPSKEDPILLLLDNHVSHCSLEAIMFCRDNGIILLSFPPHTSHRLQPLDVSVFGPFKRQCKVAFNNFLVNNSERAQGITVYDVPGLSCQPFLRAFSPENILKGFSSTGISPFNSDIFPESEFCQSEQHEETACEQSSNSVRDIPRNEYHVSSIGSSNILTQTAENDEVPVLSFNTHDFSVSAASLDLTLPIMQTISPSVVTVSKLVGQHSHITPERIRPFPKLPKKKRASARIGGSRIYTDTPEKNRIAELAAKQVKTKKDLVTKTKKPKHVKRVLESSSDESDAYSVRNSDDSTGDFVGSVGGGSDEALNIIEKITFSDDIIAEPNDYVLVKFGDKKKFFYVGLVLSVEKSSRFPLNIKYFRRKRKSNVFYEPLVADVGLALTTDIAARLPKPEQMPGSRNEHKILFKIDFQNIDIR